MEQTLPHLYPEGEYPRRLNCHPELWDCTFLHTTKIHRVHKRHQRATQSTSDCTAYNSSHLHQHQLTKTHTPALERYRPAQTLNKRLIKAYNQSALRSSHKAHEARQQHPPTHKP
ncbi:Hypothetical predicted protein [Pelobates cultripes]|uniref:Uncharacterized protein n=1 Tax=Pelobates cultripes TaxID=61616 RepID=A0AAD1VZN2_PELCU|nr:Hypothetical predicted protein [Pelobates cultripes]